MSLRKRPPPVDSGAPPSAIGIASNSWSRAPSAWRTSPSMELSAGLSCAQRDSAAHLNASGDGRRYCKGAADGPREHPRSRPLALQASLNPSSARQTSLFARMSLSASTVWKASGEAGSRRSQGVCDRARFCFGSVLLYSNLYMFLLRLRICPAICVSASDLSTVPL
jgi:hypothetical protein